MAPDEPDMMLTYQAVAFNFELVMPKQKPKEVSMRIPELALDILTEVIIRAEDFMTHKGEQDDSTRKAEQDFARHRAEKSLYCLLESLGCIWVGVSPFVYNCETKKSGNKRQIEYWLTHADSFADSKLEEIPPELYAVLKHFYEDHMRDGKAIEPRIILREITSLRERLSEVAHQLRRVRRSRVTPQLLDGGRTILCSKGKFTFTKIQSPIIGFYWKNYQNRNDYLPELDALKDAKLEGSSFEDLFRSRWSQFDAVFEKHPDERDMYRLDID